MPTRIKKIKITADPGHAWAKVKKNDLVVLGIAEKISPYSFQRGEYVYLEAHRDLGIYLEVLEKLNIPFEVTETFSNRQSRIRNYPRYRTPQGF